MNHLGMTITDYIDPLPLSKAGGRARSPLRVKMEGMAVGKAVIVSGAEKLGALRAYVATTAKRLDPPGKFSVLPTGDGRVQVARVA